MKDPALGPFGQRAIGGLVTLREAARMAADTVSQGDGDDHDARGNGHHPRATLPRSQYVRAWRARQARLSVFERGGNPRIFLCH